MIKKELAIKLNMQQGMCIPVLGKVESTLTKWLQWGLCVNEKEVNALEVKSSRNDMNG